MSKEQENYSDWIVCFGANTKYPYRLHCLRCGTIHDTKIPISIENFCKEAEEFKIKHEQCKEK